MFKVTYLKMTVILRNVVYDVNASNIWSTTIHITMGLIDKSREGGNLGPGFLF